MIHAAYPRAIITHLVAYKRHRKGKIVLNKRVLVCLTLPQGAIKKMEVDIFSIEYYYLN